MKTKLLLAITLLLFSCVSFAQKKRLLIFEKYMPGTILMHDGSKVNTKLNYDAANNNIMYKYQGKEMILISDMRVDTVYISNRTFVHIATTFLEKISTSAGNIFVNWKLREKYRGSRSIYGSVTQNKVDRVNTNFFVPGEYVQQSIDVFSLKNRNEYWFKKNGKFVKCKRLKDLFKYFPDKKKRIKDYISKNNLEFKKATDAINIIAFAIK